MCLPNLEKVLQVQLFELLVGLELKRECGKWEDYLWFVDGGQKIEANHFGPRIRRRNVWTLGSTFLANPTLQLNTTSISKLRDCSFKSECQEAWISWKSIFSSKLLCILSTITKEPLCWASCHGALFQRRRARMDREKLIIKLKIIEEFSDKKSRGVNYLSSEVILRTYKSFNFELPLPLHCFLKSFTTLTYRMKTLLS